jgi:hypothetical protein
MKENKYLAAAKQYVDESGYTEELSEANFVIPNEEDYMDFGEETEEWDVAADRPGLWENIRRKKKREGDKYKPAKPGDPDRPDPKTWKKLQKEEEAYVYVKEDSKAEYVYENPRTGETFRYNRKGAYKKDGEVLVFRGKAEMSEKQKKALDKNKDGKVTKEDFELMRKGKNKSDAAEYQGRKVTLNKPFRTPDGPKKTSVYVKNDKGNVVKVNFGDPNMEIKRDDPARRRSFRARHNCDNPGPKWKARYWSCKAW